MSYSKLKSLVANVEAIATAMKVRIDDRQATDEEKGASRCAVGSANRSDFK